MAKQRSSVRPVLIQVRETAEIAAHERTCYLERCRFDPDRLDCINIASSPQINWSCVEHADVILIGGAGAYSVTCTHEFTEPLREIVRKAIDCDRPLFGNCWGHQFIAQALGGSALTDRHTSEVGRFTAFLTDDAKDDPVFSGLADSFPTLMGHHDRIDQMPAECIELAFSERCRNQAFRVRGKPVYGTQFHTEMNGDQLIERLRVYRDSYLDSDDELEALRRQCLDTPDADRILPTFLDTFV